MWQIFLLVGILLSLILIILYSALVVASNEDRQEENYFNSRENKER